MSDKLIAFEPQNCFSKDTIAAWRHSQQHGKESPYFVLDNTEDAHGIISYDAMFGTELVILYGNRERCEEWLKDKFPRYPKLWDILSDFKEDEVRGLHKRCENVSVIWLRYQETVKGLDLVKILAHEALHTAFSTAKFVGIWVDNSAEEFFTYYQEWVMAQFLTCLGYNPIED